jgi:hypothetical protein
MDGSSGSNASPSNRKRPKGSAGRIADQLIPEEVRSKMHPRLRVEVCNWVTTRLNHPPSPDQPELSWNCRWVHWGPEPFTDSSGHDTKTWKQAYIITTPNRDDRYFFHVCTMFQTLQSQLQSESLLQQMNFGDKIEAQWNGLLNLIHSSPDTVQAQAGNPS